MATRIPVRTDVGGGDGSAYKFTWLGLLNGDDGTPIDFIQWADRSVQFVSAAWGSGGNVVWEVSNDGGTTYFTLTDPQGNAISKAANGGEAVTEITGLARPRITAGDGTTDIKCYAVVRRAQPLRV